MMKCAIDLQIGMKTFELCYYPAKAKRTVPRLEKDSPN